MRPTVYLTTTVAAALAGAALMSPTPSAAQDAAGRRAYETIVQSLGNGAVRVWSTGDSTRAVLGVSLAPARGREDTLGVRVSDVADGGPAAKAGIEEGDRIVSIDGTALRVDAADAEDPTFRDLGSRRLQRALGRHKPGDEVSLVVQRGRESRTVRVKTVAATQLAESRGAGFGYAFGPGGLVAGSGARAREILDSVRTRTEQRPALGLTIGATGSRRDTLGLFVSNVASDSPAEKAGIFEGTRVASIDGVDLRLAREDADDPEMASAIARRFTRELEKKKPGDDVSLRVWQGGAYRTVSVKAARAVDVWKGQNGFSFSFGDGDRAFTMPRVAPLMPSGMRMRTIEAPSVRVPNARVLPRTWMSAPAPVRTIVPRRYVAM